MFYNYWGEEDISQLEHLGWAEVIWVSFQVLPLTSDTVLAKSYNFTVFLFPTCELQIILFPKVIWGYILKALGIGDYE